MERLTYWNEEYGCWSYKCASGDAAKCLAAYEDTGLTPEQIVEKETTLNGTYISMEAHNREVKKLKAEIGYEQDRIDCRNSICNANREGMYRKCAELESQVEAQQQEIDRLKKLVVRVQCDRDIEASRANTLVSDKDQQAGTIMALESERNTLLEELDNAQPCFACAGFERNGGKCFGAGTCRIRDLAKLEGLEYTDHAHGESWRWRGLKEVSAIDALLGGAEDA